MGGKQMNKSRKIKSIVILALILAVLTSCSKAEKNTNQAELSESVTTGISSADNQDFSENLSETNTQATKSSTTTIETTTKKNDYISYDTVVHHPFKILSGYESQVLHKSVEDVLNAINKKDKAMLKSIMSETVLKDDKNLDSEIDKLFFFIDGAFTDYEEGLVHSYTHNNGGIIEHRLSSCVTVITNKKTYYLKIAYVNVDAQSKGNEGVLGLAFIEKELYDKYEQNGVYCFEWATLSISCLNENGEIKP